MTCEASEIHQGWLFEDILDGYFTLQDSLRQGLDRQGAGAALIVMTHAPILRLDDRPATDPVPLRLTGVRSGQIRRLMVIAWRDATGTMTLKGVGQWHWHGSGTNLRLGRGTRLAEPAFVRGIALPRGGGRGTLWRLELPQAPPQLWGFDPRAGAGLTSEQGVEVHAGEPPTTEGWETDTIIHIADPAHPRLDDAMADDWRSAAPQFSRGVPRRP